MPIRHLVHDFRHLPPGGAVIRDGDLTLVVTDVRLSAARRAEITAALLTEEEACRPDVAV